MRLSLFLYPALCALLHFVASPRHASAGDVRVVINEIYYDHPGRDDGWEFVELTNAGSDTVALAGWALESLDGVSGRSARLWTGGSGSFLPPGAILCLAGRARNPSPNHLLAGELENGPDAVRLLAPAGVADVVGWGPLVLSGLFEGGPAPDVAAGTSLSRRPDGVDSDRNDADFVPSDPTPGRRNFFARNISVSFAPAVYLPCSGSLFTLTVMMRNEGIESFGGEVRLLVSAAPGDLSRGDTIAVSGLIRLAPAARDSFAVRLRAPRAAGFSAAAFLGGAPDDWPGDDTARAELRTSPGEIVVNEIMYRPHEGESEWVELFSAGGCDLAGWTLCDAAGSERLVAGGTLILPPRGFLVLARDSAAFSTRYPRCPAPVRSPEGGWPVLNDGERDGVADRVTLRDATGSAVEAVAYRDLLGVEKGRSIERISEDACSSTPGGIWHRSAARDGATPGFENSTRLDGPPPAAGLRVEPNPFSPARHGAAVITGSAAAGDRGFRVRIFSIAGMEIRRIYGERGGARAFSCRWDGRNDAGAPMPSGMYVCLVEYMGMGGGVCGSEKICIVVARP